ncbi:hypothetical protein M427DRAFT_175755 [Gonapodya prolifera JEL478]|uniref:Uncharacterized protein n=1 Tax=Gonapodya prolifera (strain JEL478) TaxID=1344416 RepID=A0A139B0R6_GONPJ|nr:hypothetical protein M427DRAFT_175755 [Gonapodya prolifera JEL478]|eukprot:KXS22588.1 hypothetical protein M427DRAFT_175755 [Gonapodya prolifera JEL478]
MATEFAPIPNSHPLSRSWHVSPTLQLSSCACLPPQYALVFALFSLPTPLSPYSYIRPFRTPMVLLYSLIDGLGRSAGIHGTLHTLRHNPAPHQTHMRDHLFGLWVLGVIAASSGGLVDGLFGLRKKEWKFGAPAAFKDWSAGAYYRIVALASAVYVGLTDVQVARLVSQWQEDGAFKEGAGDVKVESTGAGLTSPETAQVIAGFILVAGHVLVFLVWPFLEKKRTLSVAKGPKEKKG